jgi:formylglycine-generating enzyme required for sulfatase activity
MEQSWAEASAAIAAEDEVRLPLCEGLHCLGRDPQSGLWEFVDLRLGQAPRRDEQGRVVMSEETGVIFVFLPGGRCMLGSPEDEPGRVEMELSHEVVISPLLLSKYEVTQAQWERLMGQNPSQIIGATRAVHTLSWIDCERFCEKMGYVLPTEAQWEYACRAGTSGPYNAVGPLDALGWYEGNSHMAVHPVGDKLPNAFGLYDMHGNVLEWCLDVFAEDFYSQPESRGRDPVNRASASNRQEARVLRGGSYEGVPGYLRSADRYHEKPDLRWRGFGLRPSWPLTFAEH